MKYYRFEDACGNGRLTVESEPGSLFDLTSRWDTVREFTDLLRAGSLLGMTPDQLVESWLKRGNCHPVLLRNLNRKVWFWPVH